MLDLIKNHRIATAIVLFSGLVFTIMTQLNWLYLVRNDNFEKNETIRMFLTPIGAIIIFIIWSQYVTLIKNTLNENVVHKVIFKDSISLITLLGSLHIMWSPPMNYITLHCLVLTFILTKGILYPKEIVILVRNTWNILLHKESKLQKNNYIQMSNFNNWKIFSLVSFVLFVSALGYMWLTMNKIPAQTDEGVHFEQIAMFLKGDISRHSAITMIPGYHFIVSIILYFLKLDSLDSARFISLILALASVYLFFCCARMVHSKVPIQRTLAFFSLPILFPFHFLVYTHSASLVFILLGFYYYFKRNLNICALFLGISVLVRQTNVMWIVMIFLIEYIDNNGLALSKKQILEHIRKNILLFYIIVDFVLFVVINGGRVSLATDHNPTIRTENIFFSLFVFFFIFFPFIIVNITNSIKIFINHLYLIIPIIIIFIFYLYEFQVVHKYNITGGHWIHNIIPLYMVENYSHKIVSFIPMLIVAISLLGFQLYSKSAHIFYLVWFASLVPLGLIEMRYYIPHMTLFLLFKKSENSRFEWFQSLYLIIISAIFCYLFIEHGIFP